MSRDKQIDAIYEDLVEIFDEEYNRRNLITPQNTAEKMTDKGYRKASEVAREIFEEIEKMLLDNHIGHYKTTIDTWCYNFNNEIISEIAELKKKYVKREET